MRYATHSNRRLRYNGSQTLAWTWGDIYIVSSTFSLQCDSGAASSHGITTSMMPECSRSVVGTAISLFNQFLVIYICVCCIHLTCVLIRCICPPNPWSALCVHCMHLISCPLYAYHLYSHLLHISKVGSMVFQVVDILGIFSLVEAVEPQ